MQPVEEPIVKENISNPTQTVPEVQEDVQERNWRLVREQSKLEKQHREEAEKLAREKEKEVAAMKLALDTLLSKPSSNTNNQNDPEMDEEDLKLQRRVDEALAKRDREYEQRRAQREQEEMPRKLNETHNDFDSVCSDENVDYLKYHHPEIAKAFMHMPDSFDKWSSIYKAIKKLVPNSSETDKKKIAQNLNKPQSMAVSGITGSGDSAPHQLDDKRRSDNWARMQRVMRGGR